MTTLERTEVKTIVGLAYILMGKPLLLNSAVVKTHYSSSLGGLRTYSMYITDKQLNQID